MESLLYDVTSGLVHLGYDIGTVVTGSGSLPERDIIAGVKVHRCRSYGQIASTPLSLSYLKNLRRLNADLIHLHVPNPLTSIVGLQSGTPLVISYHCDVISYPKLFSLYRPFLLRQLEHASKIIISSPQLIKSSKILSKYESKCEVIPFGIDRSFFRISPTIQNSLRELKNIYGKKLLLFVGRLVEYKGLEYLIHAMTEIDALLAVVGTGPELSRLHRLVEELGLYEKVHFMGEVDRRDLGSYYKECDALVLPSIDEREAFGICLIEALAFAKPLVTTTIRTGVNFVNLEGKTGFSVPPKNPEALAFRLNEILTHQRLAEELSINALKHYNDFFQKEKMINAHHELYNKLLSF